MKIRLKEDYVGPIPKGTYEACKADKGYALVNKGELWCISKDSVEEVDEFEEEFKQYCIQNEDVIEYPGGCISLDGDKVLEKSGCVLVWKEDIPALILALLKLMDE